MSAPPEHDIYVVVTERDVTEDWPYGESCGPIVHETMVEPGTLEAARECASKLSRYGQAWIAKLTFIEDQP
jgi:hypothetical protein